GLTPEAIHDIILQLHRGPLERIHEGHPATTEQIRLRYLYIHQGILRADVYQGLSDTVRHIASKKVNLNNLEQCIILSSTYTETNPNWPKIVNELFPG
ncbi:33650_t:CDS:2, partial [Racocetra persica]